MENKGTMRKCKDCDYRTFIFIDNLEDRKCKHCNGNLEIIASERIKENQNER